MRLGVPGLALLLAAAFLPACSSSGDDDDDASLPGDDDDSSQAGDDDTTTETDLDGDGFLPPEDCDDSKVNVNPDATESCNGIDDDCDGDADETGARGEKPFFADSDGDSYGNPDDRVQACEAPSGYVADNRDCDDSSNEVNPDQAEVCGDGVDNDCDGSGNTCGLNGDITLEVALASFSGEEPDDHAGISVAHAGDINGDGFDDLLIGAYGDDTGGPTAGAVYLLFGPVEGPIDLASADVKFTGEKAGDQAGISVAGPGDVNDDGYDDILIGAPYHDGPDETSLNPGAAYLILGGTGLSGAISLSEADAKLLGEHNSDAAGYAVGAAGDVNGDGKADLLVGAWNEPTSGIAGGAAYLFYGPVTGERSLAEADAKLVAESAYSFAGYWVSTAGDVNEDGKDDVLIGAPYESAAGTDAGAAYVVFGPIDGSVDLADADLRFLGEEIGDQAGRTLDAGDLNGDGNVDLIIPAIGSDRSAKDAGAAYVFFGPFTTGTHDLSEADLILTGEAQSDHAGQSVAVAGDIDGDGENDLLIGAVGDTGGRGPTGAVYVMYGPLAAGEIELGNADANITAAPGESIGQAVCGVGDTNGDDFTDILLGVPHKSSDPEFTGAAYLLQGGSGL